MDLSTSLEEAGVYVGRLRTPGRAHPLIVTVRGGTVFDITAPAAPTVRDVCEMTDPAGYVCSAAGTTLGPLATIERNSFDNSRDPRSPWLLSPIDLQAVKAAGVTFAASLLERVVEEQARGDAARAAQIRGDIVRLIGEDLSALRPGSSAAMALFCNSHELMRSYRLRFRLINVFQCCQRLRHAFRANAALSRFEYLSTVLCQINTHSESMYVLVRLCAWK